jgi:hypothetical protein
MAPVTAQRLRDFLDGRFTRAAFARKYTLRELGLCLKKLLRVYGTDDDVQITTAGRVLWQGHKFLTKDQIISDIEDMNTLANTENITNRLKKL